MVGLGGDGWPKFLVNELAFNMDRRVTYFGGNWPSWGLPPPRPPGVAGPEMVWDGNNKARGAKRRGLGGSWSPPPPPLEGQFSQKLFTPRALCPPPVGAIGAADDSLREYYAKRPALLGRELSRASSRSSSEAAECSRAAAAECSRADAAAAAAECSRTYLS